MLLHLFLPALLVSAPLFASTVVWTDRQHPPANVRPDTQVIYLDATEQLQQSMFGTLAADPAVATRTAFPAHTFQICRCHRPSVHGAYRRADPRLFLRQRGHATLSLFPQYAGYAGLAYRCSGDGVPGGACPR
ncbi:DUF1525 domain-containing protein [Salmonella enterica subsp. enterica serovar Woodinville]|nr:DUF1525 domain-containing protein [Salmonella enterica subsp. enterica serovar Woodinville]EDS4807054.1 DUF1525 domain-containing protein [Salmonella enterica subsp. enterica serovar Woodinville]EDW0130526.1 DUF1525 domain-containing protein [Salmonella enterica subsp. enterica serovar Woodinville]EEH6627278.1 DUF1525 domain-containing protein [Salmonella enterica]EEP1336731.1 DUF1525 domain-containing protein [Salmonella enterica]